MYNISLITGKIKTRVGFLEEPTIPLDGAVVNTAISTPMAVNKRHPLTKLKIIDKIKPQDSNLSEYLNEVIERAIYNVMIKTFTRKKLTETVKGVLSSVKSVYTMSDHNGVPTPVTDDFVGYRIAPVGSDYLTLSIKRIALSLLNPQIINIYVYHSSDLSQPISTVPLTYSKSGSPEWIEIAQPLVLDFFNKDLDRGGYYYIGIKSSDLTAGNMVLSRTDYDWNKGVCGSCHMYDKAYWDTWKDYTRYSPIKADISAGTVLENVERVNLQTWGINFSYDVECDVTQFFIDNFHLMEEATITETVCILLEEIINSTEVNRITGVTKRDAELALYGEFSVNGRERVRDGFEHRSARQLEAFSLDSSRICPTCLPKNRPKKTAIWRG